MLMILYCQDCGDVKDESFSIMNGALDEKISSELSLLWLASLSARWENLSVGSAAPSSTRAQGQGQHSMCFSLRSPSTSSHGNRGICGDVLFDNADIVGARSQESHRESVKWSRVQRVFHAKGNLQSRWAGSTGVFV